jgi:hypothetical protein
MGVGNTTRSWGAAADDTTGSVSAASPSYPQLAAFQGKTIAAYVDNCGGPNQFQLLFRVSTDNGATWGAEYAPFGTETFDSGNSAPLLVTSRDGRTLYLFHCCVTSVPQYRSNRIDADGNKTTWGYDDVSRSTEVAPLSWSSER